MSNQNINNTLVTFTFYWNGNLASWQERLKFFVRLVINVLKWLKRPWFSKATLSGSNNSITFTL